MVWHKKQQSQQKSKPNTQDKRGFDAVQDTMLSDQKNGNSDAAQDDIHGGYPNDNSG